MFKPLEIVGDTAVRTTDQKVRGSNPFERAEVSQRSYGNYQFAYCYLQQQLAKQLAKVFLACGKHGLLYALVTELSETKRSNGFIRSSLCFL